MKPRGWQQANPVRQPDTETLHALPSAGMHGKYDGCGRCNLIQGSRNVVEGFLGVHVGWPVKGEKVIFAQVLP